MSAICLTENSWMWETSLVSSISFASRLNPASFSSSLNWERHHDGMLILTGNMVVWYNHITSCRFLAHNPLTSSIFFLITLRITLFADSTRPFARGWMTKMNLIRTPKSLQKSTTIVLANIVLLSETINPGKSEALYNPLLIKAMNHLCCNNYRIRS